MVTRSGSFHLFAFRGINVFVDWSWFIAAIFLIQFHTGRYKGGSYLWCALEYLALFGIVLLHEFGHALACKQVGGQAHEIVLWPLGGVAYVSPPQRPGATLWSIAAGPLVNVVLFPLLWLVDVLVKSSGWQTSGQNAYTLLLAISEINTWLLIFNLLPIYPLDGGQILRSLLWFALGRARSLLVASIIGFVGVAVLIILAVITYVFFHAGLQSIWLGIIAGFVLLNCWQGLRQALAMARMDNVPMRFGYACPACHTAPRVGAFWGCSYCHTAFDTFATNAQCPKCGVSFSSTRCMSCGEAFPFRDWSISRPPPPPLS